MGSRIVRAAAVGIIVGGYFYLTQDIWPPIITAFVLAALLHPVITRLEARHWPRALAIATVYVDCVAITGVALFFLIPVAVRQGNVLAHRLTGLVTTLSSHKGALDWGRNVIHLPPFLAERIPAAVNQASSALATGVQDFSGALISWMPNLIWVILVPVLMFYFLLDFDRIVSRGVALCPAEYREHIAAVLREMEAIFLTYLRSLGLLCLLDAILSSLLLWALGIPYSLVLGMVAGVLYMVPFVGAILSTILITAAALLSVSLWHAVIVVIAMILLHQVFLDEIVGPRMLGGHVGLHPALSIIAMLSGYRLIGPLGTIVAVPIAASIQMLLLRLVPSLRDEMPKSPRETASKLEPVTENGHLDPSRESEADGSGVE